MTRGILCFGLLALLPPHPAKAAEVATPLEATRNPKTPAVSPSSEAPIQPRSAIEAQALLAEYTDAMRAFERTGLSMREEVRAAIKRQANKRIRYIRSLYKSQVDREEALQTKYRVAAIARFERFIRRYPNHPVHTPDALFRLAELYYEDVEYAWADAEDAREEARERGEEVAPSSEKDYSKVIRTLRALVQRFPKFRYADAASYLLGFTLIASGQDKAGRAAYLSLVNLHPKSPYAPEALLRLGELEFDYANFEAAATYYKRVTEYGPSDFFDLALYKLAWAYYQVFDYDRSIRTFKELIAHYSERAGAKGALEGREGQLRSEAIDYVAKALAEDDWDGDGIPDAGAGPERAIGYLDGGSPWEREILAAYAEVLYSLHDVKKYPAAVRVYRHLIRTKPTDPQNPRFQERIIAVYDTTRDFEAAARARGEMASLFGRGTPWFEANQQDGEALQRASLLVEVATHQRAQFHHLRAQELKVQAHETGDLDLARRSIAEYAKAAKAYADYLDRYPQSPKRYEVEFFRAEALYYAGEYVEAARTYARVRDDEHNRRYRADAGFSVISSLEQAIGAAVDAGRLPQKAKVAGVPQVQEVELPPEQADKPVRATPEPIPPLVRSWIDAIDRFIALDLHREGDPQAQPKLAYQAAEMHYRFRDFEALRARLEAILKRWPTSEVAGSAVALILNSYKEENDWENIRKWASIMKEKKLGSPEEQAQLSEAIRVFELGAQFKTAEQLLGEKKYIEAAREFERLADQPGVKFADKALYNAAMAYIQVKHYESASKAFEKILTEERFRQSPFRELALFQVGENSRKFFNFAKAISAFRALYQKNPQNENSPYALFQAAELLENDGRTQEAAELFEEYAATYRDRSDAGFALYRAAKAWRKAGERAREAAALKRYVAVARDDLGQGKPVLESMVRLGVMHVEAGQTAAAQRSFNDAIALFGQRGYKPKTPEADEAAHARFELEEIRFRAYQAIAIKGSLRQMGRAIQRSQQMLTELAQGYAEVFQYGSLNWTFAAFFRIGQGYQEFAQKLYNAPEPRGLSAEEIDIYRTQLEDEGTRWEDTAVARYEEMIRQARARKVTNDWVKKAIVFLNKYKPEAYPLAKEEKPIVIWSEAWSLSIGPSPAPSQVPEDAREEAR